MVVRSNSRSRRAARYWTGVRRIRLPRRLGQTRQGAAIRIVALWTRSSHTTGLSAWPDRRYRSHAPPHQGFLWLEYVIGLRRLAIVAEILPTAVIPFDGLIPAYQVDHAPRPLPAPLLKRMPVALRQVSVSVWSTAGPPQVPDWLPWASPHAQDTYRRAARRHCPNRHHRQP